MKIVCIGDSNTYGYDPRSYFGGRYEKTVRWTGRLAEAGFEVVNLGMNGAEIPHRAATAEHLQRRLEQLLPIDVVTVMLGSNDLLQGLTPEETTQRMERFLDTLRDFPVLLLAPPRMRRGAWVEQEPLIAASEQLAAQYAALAKRRALPFHDPGACETAHDGVHLSPTGHAQFAESLTAFLRK